MSASPTRSETRCHSPGTCTRAGVRRPAPRWSSRARTGCSEASG
ncbi:CxxxxCH/CxxCH domain-containing protein [Microbacterium maritypicum]